VLWVLLAASPLTAGIPTIPPPLARRVALADLVVVGKVTGVDGETVKADPLIRAPGLPKADFRVATLRVESVLVGQSKVEEVRVAFHQPPPPRKVPIALKPGDAGSFFLNKHPSEPFYVVSAPWDFLDESKKEKFTKDLAMVRRCARLRAEPGPGLISKDAEERLLAAAVLIYGYRTRRFVSSGPPKTAPIDAEQSRLIFQVLLEGDLEPPDEDEEFTRLTLFFSLNLTPKEGWVPPLALKDIPAAARKWLEDNAATFRLQRFVPPEK
jgi:hypothetical protein